MTLEKNFPALPWKKIFFEITNCDIKTKPQSRPAFASPKFKAPKVIFKFPKENRIFPCGENKEKNTIKKIKRTDRKIIKVLFLIKPKKTKSTTTK